MLKAESNKSLLYEVRGFEFWWFVGHKLLTELYVLFIQDLNLARNLCKDTLIFAFLMKTVDLIFLVLFFLYFLHVFFHELLSLVTNLLHLFEVVTNGDGWDYRFLLDILFILNKLFHLFIEIVIFFMYLLLSNLFHPSLYLSWSLFL